MSVTVDKETGEILEDPETPEPTPEPDDDDEAADDDEQNAEPDDEPAPHAGPVSDEEHAEVFDKAIKRAKTYMSAVPTILGDSAQDLELCPRCTDLLPGFILPLRIKPVPDEQKYAVKLSIGELSARELRQDQHSSQCSDCGGYGKVKTGSLVPRQDELQCEACQGRGWIGPRSARAAQPQPQPALGVVPDGPTPEGDPPVTDPWGRFQDDPLYGVMPGFERS
jgi:hypothetical protein